MTTLGRPPQKKKTDEKEEEALSPAPSLSSVKSARKANKKKKARSKAEEPVFQEPNSDEDEGRSGYKKGVVLFVNLFLQHAENNSHHENVLRPSSRWLSSGQSWRGLPIKI